jgi:hypothetical protein
MNARKPRPAAPPFKSVASWQSFALAGAGPVLTVSASLLVWIVWRGEFPDLNEARLRGIVFSLWGVIGLLGFVIMAATAGLVKSLELNLGAVKARIDLDDDEESAPAPKPAPPAAPRAASSVTPAGKPVGLPPNGAVPVASDDLPPIFRDPS